MPEPAVYDDQPYLRLELRIDEPVAVVTARGELDLAGVPLFEEVFGAALRAGCRRLIVEAGGLTFLDAAGLRAMCAPAMGADAGIEVRVREPSRPVRRILQMTGLCALVEPTEPAGPAEGRGVLRPGADAPRPSERDSGSW